MESLKAALTKDETYDPGVNLAEGGDTLNNCYSGDSEESIPECDRIYNDFDGLSGHCRTGGPQSDSSEKRGECPGNRQHSTGGHSSGRVMLAPSQRVYLCTETGNGCRGVRNTPLCAGCRKSDRCPLCGEAAAEYGVCPGVLHVYRKEEKSGLLAPTTHVFQCLTPKDNTLSTTLLCKECRSLTHHCPLNRRTCGRSCRPKRK